MRPAEFEFDAAAQSSDSGCLVMTSWTPAAAAAYIAANGLETAFYSRYPNAYGAEHAADWAAIWLDASNVPPPSGPDDGSRVDISGAVAEERVISQSPDYVMPFTPVASSTPIYFPPADGTAAAAATTGAGNGAGNMARSPATSGKWILAGVLAWLIFRNAR